MPNLNMTADPCGKVTSRGGEGKRCDRGLEGKVIDGDPPKDVCQDCAAIFID